MNWWQEKHPNIDCFKHSHVALPMQCDHLIDEDEMSETIDALHGKVISWFGSGDTGMSSKSIAIAGSGGDRPKYGWSYPYDPDDFGRCARLLEKIPELKEPAFERLQAEGGEKWRSLITRWDDVHASMENEVGIDWSKGRSAPDTYKLMKSIGL